MKIIVLNLPKAITKQELTDLFEVYGTISACDLVMDKESGLSKGFGFIEMPSEDEAKIAIMMLHGRKVAKNKIRVKFAEDGKSSK